MTNTIFDFPDPFLDTAQGQSLPITVLTEEQYEGWFNQQPAHVQNHLSRVSFTGKPGEGEILYTPDGKMERLLAGVSTPVKLYDVCPLVEMLKKQCSEEGLQDTSFVLESPLSGDDLTQICSGWGLACYDFQTYKSEKKTALPRLVWPDGADKTRIKGTIESTSLLKNLINTPANDLGTEELADAAKHVAKTHSAAFKVISGKELEKGFPLIHAVGAASPRRPRLVDMQWGDKKHPKLTLVGKGIIFDTGGLNIKTGKWMGLMKKDMGGAAHALSLAWMIMKMQLPVNLRVILPIAENAIAGEAMRPSDVVQSRKGLYVEIKDTDAEGRLVLADALALASEDKPNLLIDCATLTGSARAALGFDIPAIFSNSDKLADELRDISLANEDPLWPLPLWQPYFKDIESNIGDIANDGTGMAGAIYGGLFLEKFVEEDIDWIHLDMYAWEQSGRPGRPQGGADTGMRSLFKLLEKRYS